MKQLFLRTCLSVVALFMAASSFAQEFEVDGIYYDKINSTSVEVADGRKCSGSVTIPSSVIYKGETYAVTSIGECAFAGCSGLTSIEIPSSVTEIGYGAFYGCSGLTKVVLCDGSEKLWYDRYYYYDDGDYLESKFLFEDCPIETLYLGRFVSCWLYDDESPYRDYYYDLKEGAEKDCWCETSRILAANKTLKNVTISSSVTFIGNDAFAFCSGLSSIDIPSSVAKIGERAFAGCSGLTSIEIPSSVTKIGKGAFSNCSNLTHAVLSDGSESLVVYGYYDFLDLDIEYVFQFKDQSVFDSCPIESLYIGRNIQQVNYDMGSNDMRKADLSSLYLKESNQKTIKSVTISPSVTYIGNSAFYGCSGLTSVTFEKNSSVTSIGNQAFSGCSGLTSIEIPSSVTEIGSSTFYGCSGLTSIEIPSSVTEIGNSTFSGCSELTSIEIPSSVTSIGEYAFSGCSELTSIEIPSSVTEIGKNAFSRCSNLTHAVLSDGSESLVVYGYYSDFDDNFRDQPVFVFGGCPIESLYIGRNIQQVYYYLDIDYLGFIRDTLEIWEDLSSLYLTESNQKTIKSVTISPSVTYIGNSAFYGCSGLTSIEIPSSVTEIGYGAFSGCEKLKVVFVANEEQKEMVESSGYAGIIQIGSGGVAIGKLTCKIPREGTAVVTVPVYCQEENVTFGIEYRMEGQEADVFDQVHLADGTLVAVLTGLAADAYYVRPFYLLTDGTYGYGEWQVLKMNDVGYDEPTILMDEAVTDETSVTLTAVSIAGTDDIIEQGFEYWIVDGNEVKSLRGVPDTGVQKVLATGERMSVELTDLDAGTTYGYRAFATTASGTTYGDERTFTTSDSFTNGIDNLLIGRQQGGEPTEVARYNLNGVRIATPQRGVNIIRMSDGTTRKVLVKTN